MLLISLLPMGMVVLYNQTESAEMMKRWEIDALQLLAISKARSLDQLFQDALNDALLVANDSDVRYFLRSGSHSAIEQATMNNFLEDVKNLNPAYYHVILLNREGQAIAGTRGTRLGLDYKNTPSGSSRQQQTTSFLGSKSIARSLSDPCLLSSKRLLIAIMNDWEQFYYLYKRPQSKTS